MAPQPGKALKPQGERRQRRHPRYRVEFPVGIVLFSGEERQHLQAHGRDLSLAGMGVLIADDLALGDVMGLSFSLPGSPGPWNVQAVLRYRRGYQYGFEFLALSDAQTEALAAYLPRLERLDRDGGVLQRNQGANERTAVT